MSGAVVSQLRLATVTCWRLVGTRQGLQKCKRALARGTRLVLERARGERGGRPCVGLVGQSSWGERNLQASG